MLLFLLQQLLKTRANGKMKMLELAIPDKDCENEMSIKK